MVFPHSLILNRLQRLHLSSEREEGLAIFCNITPISNGVYAPPMVFSQSISEKYQKTPEVYDLSFLMAGDTAPIREFQLTFGVRFKTEVFHQWEGVIRLENMGYLGVSGLRKWEINDDVFSVTVVFKEN